MKKTIFIFLMLGLIHINPSIAQEKVSTMSISASVEVEDDNGEQTRNFTLKIEKGDNETKVIKWSDEGKIPADLLTKLKKEGITVIDGENPQFIAKSMEHNSDVEEEFIIEKSIDSDGEQKIIIESDEIEWTEDNEKINKMLQEKGINVEDLGGENVFIIKTTDEEMSPEMKEKVKKIKVKVKKGEDGDRVLHFDTDGNKIEKEIHSKSKTVIKIKDDNGMEKVLEWDGEGDMPEEMKQIMDEHDLDGYIHKSFKKHKKYKVNSAPNKAVMGAHIQNAENGVEIVEVMLWSGAEDAGLNAGDIITEVDGKKTKDMSALLEIFSDKNPGDKVKVKYVRNGKNESTKLKLKHSKKN